MKKRKLKGFTLVEVMTSTVILAILITIASGVIITTFNIFGRNTLMRAAQDNGNNVYNTIYDHISYATALKISENADIYDKDYFDFLDAAMIETESNGTDYETVKRIVPYYELMSISSSEMKIERKTVPVAVSVYGNDSNSMYGCECVVEFSPYTEGADTLHFSVTIQRDSEVFYTRSGDIPLLNETVKTHIKISDDVTDGSADEIRIFYTYLQ